MNKHVPVLLEPVKTKTAEFASKHDELFILDCTLGQAGHSFELFKLIKRGVLISIDLDLESIQWVAQEYKFQTVNVLQFRGTTVYLLQEGDKSWYILQWDFSKILELQELFQIHCFDLIIADLGFSNMQLSQNLGISFDRPDQRLDMRYFRDPGKSLWSGTAAEALNTLNAAELKQVLLDFGQIDYPDALVNDIINSRKIHPFSRVRDLIKIVSKSKYPKNYKIKLFQALRSFVNKENERLLLLLQNLMNVLREGGICMIITFNSLEEKCIEHTLKDVTKIEPNITEIISNPQSRSAKLYLFEKKKSAKTEKGK